MAERGASWLQIVEKTEVVERSSSEKRRLVSTQEIIKQQLVKGPTCSTAIVTKRDDVTPG